MVRKTSEIKEILNAYKAELKKHGVRVSRMFLYGSYARGNPKSYSDIDVVVVSSDLAKYSPLRRQEFLSLRTIPIDAPLEVIGYTPKEFSSAKGTIFGQILKRS
ncbi:MAG: nucleotidyltransferase domain-containing protein [Candidatus Omnitrophica bacterium]|nr:nucleotidyltransferase domain-containing protein [Candidatus Omnitrophota bacterium]